MLATIHEHDTLPHVDIFSLRKARMTRQHWLLWRGDTEGCVGGLWLKYDTVLRCVIRLVITIHCNLMPGTPDHWGAMTLLMIFFITFCS